MSLAQRLQECTALDPEKKSIRLGDLWKERPAVIAFVRHFG